MNEKLKIYDEKMQKTIHALDTELASIRAGRANPNILNKLTVEHFCSGSTYDPDPAMGKEDHQRY